VKIIEDWNRRRIKIDRSANDPPWGF
jgi:hypothetical protein